MPGFLRDRRLRTKFLMLIGVFLVALTGTIGMASYLASERMMTDRTLELQAVVDVGYGLAESLQKDVQAGNLTVEEAHTRFRAFVHNTRYGPNGDFLFAISFDGVGFANPRAEAEGVNTWNQQSRDGRYTVREIIAAGRAGSGTVDYAYPRLNGGDPVGKRSFVRAFAPWEVVIATGTYTDDLARDVRGHVMVLLMVALCAIVVASILAWVLARDITDSMRTLRQRLQSLATGDHASPVGQTERRDEIGEMARALEVVRAGADAAIRLRGEQDALKQQNEKASAEVLLRLADSIQNTVGGVVEDLTDQAAGVQKAAGTLSRSAGTARTQVDAVAELTSESSANVQAVSAGAEELSASINEISQRVSDSARVAREARHQVEATNAMVAELSAAAGKIGEVVALIQGIAGQTNLLALNATIEAARAGDAGKGFAVVASEVKTLAAQTGRATEDIRGQIERIQSATGQAVSAVAGIASTVAEMDSISATIAAAVEEQGAATREIAGNVARAAQATEAAAESVVGLRSVSEDVHGTSEAMLKSAQSLSDSAASLRGEVTRFVSEVRGRRAA
jgi:methyl-accepting chemotaxis protein